MVTPEIEHELRGSEPRTTDFPAIGNAALIRQFMSGESMKVGQKRRKGRFSGLRRHEMAELERLEGIDEVWVLCFRTPRPGWRVVGRFLERDVLVLMRMTHKHDMGSDYGPIATDVIKDWNNRFGLQPPCRGDWISGYLSGAHYDVDEKAIIGGD